MEYTRAEQVRKRTKSDAAVHFCTRNDREKAEKAEKKPEES